MVPVPGMLLLPWADKKLNEIPSYIKLDRKIISFKFFNNQIFSL
jgi:hypothetical protein